MSVEKRLRIPPVIQRAGVFAFVVLMVVISIAAQQPGAPQSSTQQWPNSSRTAIVCEPPEIGSPYISVDSWVYPAVERLYSLGYIDQVYLGMRPWTRASLSHMLQGIDAEIEDANRYADSTAGEAQDTYTALIHFLHYDAGMQCLTHQRSFHVESVYTVGRGVSGTPLHDSYHLGSTIINDYGRPYESGFNNYSGASGYATAGRFTLYVRGEFEVAPSATGYSSTLAQ